MRRCTECGSTETIEQIRAKYPRAISCCPERNFVEDEPPDVKVVDVSDELHQILGEALRRDHQ